MDDVVRLDVVGQLLRKRWRLLAALVVIGALIGGAAWWVLAPGYVATSKVLLQGSPGEQGVLAETQIATSLVVLDEVADALGGGLTGSALQDRVTASVVDGNVVSISVVDGSGERAQDLTHRITQEYMTFSARIVGEAANATAQVLQVRRDQLQRQVDETRDRITALQGAAAQPDGAQSAQARAELDRLGNDLANSTAELQDATAQVQEADAEVTASRGHIVVIETAVLRGPASPTVVQMAGGGAVLAAGFGLFGLVFARQRDRRLREPGEIATAVGAPLLAGVSVAVEPADAERRRVRESVVTRLHALLRDDELWSAEGHGRIGEPAEEEVRYRRVLSRLRTPEGELRLTLVMAEGDGAARRAVAAMVSAAQADSPSVSVVTDDADLTAHLEVSGAAGAAASAPIVRGTGHPTPYRSATFFKVVVVEPAHPIISSTAPTSGAVVIVPVGSLTAWELIGIAGACVDAGLEVLGALVALPARPEPRARPEPVDSTPMDAEPVVDDRPAAATADAS